MKNIFRKIFFKIKNTIFKKHISCPLLEHAIMFDQQNKIRVCSTVSELEKGRPLLLDNYHGELIDWDNLFQKKNVHRNIQKSGENVADCQGCHFLRNQYWDKKNYIDELLLTHWTKCNSNCIYCPVSNDKELLQNTTHYNIVPVLKDAINKKVFKKNSLIEIAGGESTIYPEFDELIELLLSNGFSNIVLNTSAIEYKNIVEKAILSGVLSVIVSVDAGFKSTHKKIKRTDSFDIVWKNIFRYSQAQAKINKTNLVKTKYILVPTINDSKEEIDEFVSLNCKNNIKSVALNVEIDWFKKNIEKDTLEVYNLINYSISKFKKYDISYKLYPQAYWIVKKHEKI